MGDILGGGKKDKAAEQAMKHQEEQMERLKNLSLPELKEYMLENPELVGLLDAETIEATGLKDIQLDPSLKQNQMDALQGLKDRSEQGLTAQDKYAMETMLGDVSANERSQRASIEDQMTRQGMDASGFAERTKREAVQSGANNARAKAMQMAAQGQQNRMSALQALGSQSGQMEQAEYGRKANAASAQDAISRANAMNRQNVSGQNLAARQAIENQRAGTANQQSAMTNNLAQQRYNNEVTQVTGMGNVANNMSGIAANAQDGPSGLMSTISGAAQGYISSGGNPWGAAAGGAAGYASSREDGGIIKRESMPIQDQQRAQQQEYRDAESKQHESFKKKYMKRIQDEVMGSADKPKTPEMPQGKADGGLIHAENGTVARTPEEEAVLQQLKKRDSLNRHTADFDAANSGNPVDSPSGIDTTRVNERDFNSIVNKEPMTSEAVPEESGMDKEDMMGGMGALAKMLNQKQPEKKAIDLGEFSMGQPENIMAPMQQQQFANPFGQAEQAKFANGGLQGNKQDNAIALGGRNLEDMAKQQASPQPAMSRRDIKPQPATAGIVKPQQSPMPAPMPKQQPMRQPRPDLLGNFLGGPGSGQTIKHSGNRPMPNPEQGAFNREVGRVTDMRARLPEQGAFNREIGRATGGSPDLRRRAEIEPAVSREDLLQRLMGGGNHTMGPGSMRDRFGADRPELIKHGGAGSGILGRGLKDLIGSKDKSPRNAKKFNSLLGMAGAAFEDGGTPTYASDGMGAVIDSGEESFAGDRVDAKVNDGEMVVNLPQQQRLMDLIRGEISVDELGTDDIVEGVPRELRDEMHEESDGTDNVEAIQALLAMLEK